METFTLKNLPISCSINSAYKNIQGGRAKSKKYLEYITQFNAWARIYRNELAYCRNFLKNELHPGYIKLELNFYFKKHQIFTKDGRFKKLDTSNRIKTCEDLLCEALGTDDSELISITATKSITDKTPYCSAIFSFGDMK